MLLGDLNQVQARFDAFKRPYVQTENWVVVGSLVET